MRPPVLLRLARGFLPAAGLFALLLAIGSPAEAQHRARLARGLEAVLASHASGEHEVLVILPQSEVKRVADAYDLTIVSLLDTGAVLSGTAAELDALANDPAIGTLSLNGRVSSTMAVSTQATGANQLWSAGRGTGNFDGLTGEGVGICVLDSGIAPHGDVSSRVAYSIDFTGGDGTDEYGHGTHIASIIAGSGVGSRSEDGSAHVGMAPGATLISVRVLEADGTGAVADVIKGIEWCVRNQSRYGIQVINLSLGHLPTTTYRDDPLAIAVERASAAGLVVPASAGNHGKLEDGTAVVGMVVSPGYTPSALTVGALNTRGTVGRSDDQVASYSSRGPVGDEHDPDNWEIKPDVVAPGNAIIAAGAVDSYLWRNYPERRVFGASGGTYLNLSGASMATAMVSGAVAQLLQLQPNLTPAEVKLALQFTAGAVAGAGLIDQGAGSINVPLAVELVKAGELEAAPTTNIIGGETVASGQVAFGNTIVWGARGGSIGGDTIVWGARGGSVGGDTIVWGARGGN